MSQRNRLSRISCRGLVWIGVAQVLFQRFSTAIAVRDLARGRVPRMRARPLEANEGEATPQRVVEARRYSMLSKAGPSATHSRVTYLSRVDTPGVSLRSTPG
jgi:hypothetical protein